MIRDEKATLLSHPLNTISPSSLPIRTKGPLHPHSSWVIKVWHVQLGSVGVGVLNAEGVEHQELAGFGGAELSG